MFVLDQKLTSGQRVTLRLLEDYNQDGVRIPANTHLAAICKIGDRLELQVRSLEMNGRIIPLALDAYDTDGLQGIYCPETASARNSRKAADDAVSTAGQTFGGLVGDIASTVIRTGASIYPLVGNSDNLSVIRAKVTEGSAVAAGITAHPAETAVGRIFDSVIGRVDSNQLVAVGY